MIHVHNVRDSAYEENPIQCAVIDKMTDVFKLRILQGDQTDPLMIAFIKERIENL